MRVAVLGSETAIPSIKKTFAQQKCIGIEFEYYTEAYSILAEIETRGFYVDKLVIITSLFSDWGDVDRQTFINKLINICDTLSTSSEIYILDSQHIFRVEYSNMLSVYPQVVYQPQAVRASELFNIITGDIQHEEAENIDNSVKPKSIFSKLLGRRGNASNQPQQTEQPEQIEEKQLPLADEETTEPQYSDEALFDDSESVSPQNNYIQTEIDDDDVDLEDYFGTPSAPVFEDDNTPNREYSDKPLFSDPTFLTEDHEQAYSEEPEEPEEPIIVAPPKAKTPSPKKAQPATIVRKPKPQPAPQKISKKAKSDYISVFQKRTKIILCTGERRSGVSTAMSNMAQQAVNDGLAVLVVDLDFERRGQAINFPFQADETDTQLAFSLFRAASAPMNLPSCVVHLEDGLDFLGTALAVSAVTSVEAALTDEALKQILSTALAAYDLIFVDCPYPSLRKYQSLIAMSNIAIHSVMTDYRSIVNTLNAITPDDFDSVMDYNLYLSKVMFLLNNFTSHFWNSTELNEKTLLSYMADLTGEDFYKDIAVLGRIPHMDDYDEYMDSGALFVSTKKYSPLFITLLNELASRG